MNIFILDESPVLAAQYQCDKHVVKMIVESAQMLSTAHRILDGKMKVIERISPRSGKPRKLKVYQLDQHDADLYGVTHPGHPSTIWTMATNSNYLWHYHHFIALCDEYTHRYGKKHKTDTKLRGILYNCPQNIPHGPMTKFALAMQSQPQCINHDDPIGSYRAFYQTKQGRFKMKWTNREKPTWFVCS